MGKKKDRKKKEKKTEAKSKLKEKKNTKKVKLKEKAIKEKARDKKAKINGKKVGKDTGKVEKPTPVKEPGKNKTHDNTSISVNARTAVSNIRSLGSVEEIKEFVKGDARITVKEAATLKIANLSGK